jgi:hypothetical protein
MSDLTRQMHMVVGLDRLLVDKLNTMAAAEAKAAEAALHDPDRRGLQRSGDEVTVFLDGKPFTNGPIS